MAGYKAQHSKQYFDKRLIIRYIAIVVLLISAVYMIFVFADSAKSAQVNDDLSELRANASEEELRVIKPESYDENNNSGMIDDISIDDVVVEPNDIENEYGEIIFQDPIEMLPAMKVIYDENNDTVGWITVSNTNIDYPVMQTTDNDFYLHNDFYKEPSQPGTIFADYRATVNDYDVFQSDVITLYGHKQYDGTMFGNLHNYHNNIWFYRENPTFAFSNLYNEYTYKIIAMFVCKSDSSWIGDDEELFDYQNYIDFDDKHSREKFLDNIKAMSEINTTVDIQDGDKFMILSTCAYEFKGARFVVVGRRVRPGESATVDVENAVKNKT